MFIDRVKVFNPNPWKKTLKSKNFMKFEKVFMEFLENPTQQKKKFAVQDLNDWKDELKLETSGPMMNQFIDDIEFTLNTTDIPVLFKRPPEPPAFDTHGTFVTYRGDTRDPKEIGGSKEPKEIKGVGFQLWPAAQQTLTNSKGIQGWLANWAFAMYHDTEGASGSRAFADYCRASKDRGRPTISTSLDDGCGGYDSGYIYLINIDGLREYPLTEEVMGCKVPWKPPPLRLYLDQNTIAKSTTVGINLCLSSWEVVFLTNIDASCVKKFKRRGEQFKNMPPAP